MTSFTVLPNTAVQPGGRPRGSTITALRDNVVAAFEGDATAVAAGVQVRRLALVDAIINRTKLDTGTGSQAYSYASGGGTTTVNLNAYCFFPAHQGTAACDIKSAGATADLPVLILSASGTSSGTIRWRYINV